MDAPRDDAFARVRFDHGQCGAIAERLQQVAGGIGGQMGDDQHGRAEALGQRGQQTIQDFDAARRTAEHDRVERAAIVLPAVPVEGGGRMGHDMRLPFLIDAFAHAKFIEGFSVLREAQAFLAAEP